MRSRPPLEMTFVDAADVMTAAASDGPPGYMSTGGNGRTVQTHPAQGVDLALRRRYPCMQVLVFLHTRPQGVAVGSLDRAESGPAFACVSGRRATEGRTLWLN